MVPGCNSFFSIGIPGAATFPRLSDICRAMPLAFPSIPNNPASSLPSKVTAKYRQSSNAGLNFSNVQFTSLILNSCNSPWPSRIIWLTGNVAMVMVWSRLSVSMAQAEAIILPFTVTSPRPWLAACAKEEHSNRLTNTARRNILFPRCECILSPHIAS
ncbi:hypothetical protein D3C80_1411640 [compost metagenome]